MEIKEELKENFNDFLTSAEEDLKKQNTDSYNKRVSKGNAFKLKENVEKIKRTFKTEE